MRYNKKEEIGKLRERIIVQSVSRAVGLTGFGTETWSTVAEIWATVDYKGNNKEEVEGGKITALSQIKVICRYRTDINEQQRLIYIGKYYQIENVQISVDSLYLHLFCSYAQNYV
jgi:SPP1 family predicted phage head-tail adaptor